MSLLLEMSAQSIKWPLYSKGLKRFLEDKREKAQASAQLEKFRDPRYDALRDEIQDLLNEKISVQFFKKTPEKRLGYGSECGVYECRDKNNEPAALKLYIANSYDYRYKPDQDASCPEELRYLRSLIPVVRMLISSLKSPHLVRAKGLAYVESGNRWGIVFEKINGKQWEEVRKSLAPETFLPPVIKLLSDVAKGFQILDNAGWSHEDATENNFMIRSEDGSAVVIDIPRVSGYNPEQPLRLRQKFGFFCSRDISPHLVEGSPSKHKQYHGVLKILFEKCQSQESMGEFGWKDIIRFFENLEQDIASGRNM